MPICLCIYTDMYIPEKITKRLVTISWEVN